VLVKQLVKIRNAEDAKVEANYSSIPTSLFSFNDFAQSGAVFA